MFDHFRSHAFGGIRNERTAVLLDFRQFETLSFSAKSLD